MPRRRVRAKVRIEREIPDALWKWLKNGQRPTEADPEAMAIWFDLEYFGDKLERLWSAVRSALLAEWIEENPGTRPWPWWAFDAPRQSVGAYPGCFYDGKLQVPRKQIAGAGSAPWECGFNLVPEYRCGVPRSWFGFNAEDPPVFESETVYLRRHGLLTTKEQRSVSTAHNAPVAVEFRVSEMEKLMRFVGRSGSVR